MRKLSQYMFKIVGLFFVGLAMLGVVLPVLPTTPFLLVAAYCFAKSSPALYKKLLNNKIFGPLIYNWQHYRCIEKRAKYIALLTMVLSVIVSAFIVANSYLLFLIILLMLFPFIFVWRLPEKTNQQAEPSKD